jgi:methylthioribose-1-phosphate isomerase
MPASQDDRARDPSRREFFRTFSRDAVRNLGTAVGAAAELRRSSTAAARELLDLGTIAMRPEASAQRLSAAPAQVEQPEPTTIDSTFRSPYRFTGQEMVVLDQRRLPGAVTTFACADASQVASAIRDGAVNRGPVLAEVAAYALAVAAGAAAGRPPHSLDQHFNAAANTLRGARADVHALAYGIERSEARYRAHAGDEVTAEQMRDELKQEADEIVTQATTAHAQIGQRAAAAILELGAGSGPPAGTADDVVHVLMHGDMGPLSCGLIGTGTAALVTLVGAGRHVHVWLTEAGPGNEGARIAALQLTQLDLPHTIVSDSAVGWVLTNRAVAAIMLRADVVCANGDVGTIIGGANVAQLAAAASVPVYVLAPRSAFDPAAADGSALAVEMRSASEKIVVGDASDQPAGRPSVIFGVRLDPRSDVVPAELIGRLISEGPA